MPAQRIRIEASQGVFRHEDRLPVQFIVVPPVVELFLDAAANLEAQIRRHGHVACIEQAVDVAPKQKSVRCLMFAAIAVRANMCGFERWQGSLMRDSAAPIVDVRDENPERALPEARPDELRLAETCVCTGRAEEVRPL
jgi:hypothetical protein